MENMTSVNESVDPFLVVVQSEQVTCAKCGCEMPSPGRAGIKTTGDTRYYCDCITEDEIQDLVKEWNNFCAMINLSEDNPQ